MLAPDRSTSSIITPTTITKATRTTSYLLSYCILLTTSVNSMCINFKAVFMLLVLSRDELLSATVCYL